MNGGGLFLSSNCVVEMKSSNASFVNNTSEGDGGGIYAFNIASFEIESQYLNFI